MKRFCNTCGVELGSLNWNPSSVRQKKYVCNPCLTAYRQKWNAANPGRSAVYRARWAEANPDRVLANTASHYARNREARIEYAREYYEANRDRVLARQKARRAAKKVSPPADKPTP